MIFVDGTFTGNEKNEVERIGPNIRCRISEPRDGSISHSVGVRSFRVAFIASLALLLQDCATPPADPDALAAYNEANDPLEPMNRQIFAFNEAADKYLIRPLAEGYVAIVPEPGRRGIRNFLNNLRSPVVLANDLMQAKFERAGITAGRAIVNTTIGIGGLLDVASNIGLPYHNEDFGQTLAVWGVGEGPYLMLPILGPSNPRDAAGMAADIFLDPLDWYLSNIQLSYLTYVRYVIDGIDKRAQVLDSLDRIKQTSLDFYSAIRSIYRQRRDSEIHESEAKPGALSGPQMSEGGAGGQSTKQASPVESSLGQVPSRPEAYPQPNRAPGMVPAASEYGAVPSGAYSGTDYYFQKALREYDSAQGANAPTYAAAPASAAQSEAFSQPYQVPGMVRDVSQYGAAPSGAHSGTDYYFWNALRQYDSGQGNYAPAFPN